MAKFRARIWAKGKIECRTGVPGDFFCLHPLRD